MRYNTVKNAETIINNANILVKNPAQYKGKWHQLFGNNHPICLELGMGRGSFILEMALTNPNINFIGLELDHNQTAYAINNIGKEIKTSLLNDVINDAYILNPPPSYKGRRLKIYFVNQEGVKPPKFTFHVNDKGLVHFSYYRYLENKIRESFDFYGTPIVLKFKNRGEE